MVMKGSIYRADSSLWRVGLAGSGLGLISRLTVALGKEQQEMVYRFGGVFIILHSNFPREENNGIGFTFPS